MRQPEEGREEPYVFLLFGVMALCLMGGIYWTMGTFLSLYGVNRKRRCIRLLCAGSSFLFLFLCSRWIMLGLIGAYLTGACILQELLAALIRRARKHGSYRPQKESGGYLFFHRLYHSGMVPVCLVAVVLGWGFPVRNMGKCEYVVIHLQGE